MKIIKVETYEDVLEHEVEGYLLSGWELIGFSYTGTAFEDRNGEYKREVVLMFKALEKSTCDVIFEEASNITNN